MKHNIKKLIFPLFAAAIFLTACGSYSKTTEETAQTEQDSEEASAYTSKDIYNALTESGCFSELVSLDNDYMLNYFGIDTADLKDYAAGEASDVMNADAVIILNTDSEEAAAAAAEKLNTYKERKISELTSYNPAELPKTEAAEVKAKGTFTYILICDDPDSAEKILEGYFK